MIHRDFKSRTEVSFLIKEIIEDLKIKDEEMVKIIAKYLLEVEKGELAQWKALSIATTLTEAKVIDYFLILYNNRTYLPNISIVSVVVRTSPTI